LGKRREPRKPVQVKVRIFGTDAEGRIFSENVTTLDVSNSGVRLSAVRAKLKIDEIIGLTCGTNKIHFRVKRIGAPGTPTEGCVGLVNLTPERPLWDFPLPHAVMDNFRAESLGDRRHSPRVKCAVSVELRSEGEPTMWGKASDLSLGGCFVEMPIPLKEGSNFEISLWLSGTKLKLQACVASSAPGFGIGVRFLEVPPQDQELLSRFLQTVAKEA
jgi:PilZ domain